MMTRRNFLKTSLALAVCAYFPKKEMLEDHSILWDGNPRSGTFVGEHFLERKKWIFLPYHKLSLVSIYAVYCNSCLLEMESLEKLFQKHENVFIGGLVINNDGKPGNPFRKAAGKVHYPLLGETAFLSPQPKEVVETAINKFHQETIGKVPEWVPETYFIKRRKIIHKVEGYEEYEHLEKLVEKYK